MRAVVLALLATSVAYAGEPDDITPRSLVFVRGGKLIKSDGRGRNETTIATLPAKRTVRALRVDSTGHVLLADVGGTWAWMPLDGSTETLTDLPCEAGPAQLSVDGTYVLCRRKAASLVVNLKSGKLTPIDVPAAGARLTGSGATLRLVWVDAQGVWNAIPPLKRMPKKVAPTAPLRGFLASPDGTHALGVYADEVYDTPRHKKPGDVLKVFALDGIGAQRKSVQNGIPVEWSHDSKWALVQDGSSACITLAAGGQYKCWRGYTAQSVTSDGKYVLMLGNRDRGRSSEDKKSKSKKRKKSRKSSKAEKKAAPPPDEQPAEGAEAEGDEHGDEPVVEDEVPVAPPSGSLSLYRGELNGPYTNSPQLVARDVEGAAVWIPAQ